jgi:hypothetical protein
MTHVNSVYYQMIKVSTNMFKVLPNMVAKWFGPNLFELKFVLKIFKVALINIWGKLMQNITYNNRKLWLMIKLCSIRDN